jgi:hypothetical protein
MRQRDRKADKQINREVDEQVDRERKKGAKVYENVCNFTIERQRETERQT